MIIYNKKDSKSNQNQEDKQQNYFNIQNFFKDFFSRNRFLIFIIIGVFLVIIMISLFSRSLSNEPVSSKNGLSINLIGDNTIIISRGSSFLDPGYLALDKKEGDLTDKVQVTGILDTGTLGTYTRYYTVINDKGTLVEIKRNIIVKERTEKSVLTITLNGNSIINLKLGATYFEPGYVANDSIEGNLTDKVEVSNSVNSKIEGTYRVTYKVTNKAGDSKEVSRTVKVVKEPVVDGTPTKKLVNFNVSINTSATALTNKNVTINVVISGTGYSHTILPTSQKTYQTVINYSTVRNDTYIFTVYDVNGEFKTYQQVVDNIDRIAPTGNCTGKIEKYSTILEVQASDSLSGVANYLFKSGIISYRTSSTKYILNFATKTASVTIFDKVGNYREVNCYIEGEIPKIESLPLVYIYNTHAAEKYKAIKNTYNLPSNITAANYMLQSKLKGLGIISIVEEHPSYSRSYKDSRKLMESAKAKNPSLKYFIDLHRDSVTGKNSTITIKNKSYARFLFVIGLENKNYKANKQVADNLSKKINSLYPNLCRGIYQKKGSGVNGVYNQDFNKNTMLIEIGGTDTNLNHVNNSTEVLAKVLYEYIRDNKD